MFRDYVSYLKACAHRSRPAQWMLEGMKPMATRRKRVLITLDQVVDLVLVILAILVVVLLAAALNPLMG